MAVLAFLRGLVVVRVRREDGVDTRARGEFFRFFYRLVRRVRGCAGNDGDASGGDFDGRVDDVQPFVVRESRSLAGGAAGDEEIDARFDLPRDQIAQGGVVDGAVLMKRSDQSGAASTKLHRDKIARMSGEGKSCDRDHTGAEARWFLPASRGP